MPLHLQATLDRREGFDDVVSLLRRGGVRRIVVTGNGASFYVAQALWLTAVGSPAPKPVVALPAGVLLSGAFDWTPGDALLAVSASGELRDLLAIIGSKRGPSHVAAVTGAPSSPVARAADAYAMVPNPNQRAITHTQAYCGALLACLQIWSEVAQDAALGAVVADASSACARAITGVDAWLGRSLPLDVPATAIVYGTGVAWAAALECSLLLKEVARVEAEGLETREAATSAMTAATAKTLVVGLPSGYEGDPLVTETAMVLQGRGATVVQVPGGCDEDRRLSPITTFPAAAALSIELGLRRNIDVDSPDWFGSYLATARARPIDQARAELVD